MVIDEGQGNKSKDISPNYLTYLCENHTTLIRKIILQYKLGFEMKRTF